MPRKRKTSSVVTPVPEDTRPYALSDKADWGGFINIRLSDDQKEAFYRWLEGNRSNVFPALEDLASDGMKIAFSYDAENECVVVTFTGRLLSGDTSRWCMTTRAGTLAEALALACWKHYELAQCDYSSYAPRENNFRSWG